MKRTRTTERIECALSNAVKTQRFWLGEGILPEVSAMFKALFPGKKAAVIADCNTFPAAGREVDAALRAAGIVTAPPWVFDAPPHVDPTSVDSAVAHLKSHGAIAVAVGAGSINDLCKVAADRLGQQYLCVATAASVDGYASSGAPMTTDGFKKTVPCAAPLGIVADIAVLRLAPYGLTASGYADLVAKVPAGADWIIADALGAGDEPIHAEAWAMVQGPLEGWINRPQALKDGDSDAFSDLFEGLTLSGFAMQAANSSRPASGCEHMFSHTWEMSGLKGLDGVEPSHGFKVAIGSLASTAVMKHLFSVPFTQTDIPEAKQRYPSWSEREASIRQLFGKTVLGDRIVAESHAKHLDDAALMARLERVATSWEILQARVNRQLMDFQKMREMFRVAGCPTRPRDIGLSLERCAATVIAAQMIRSRYTVLDLAYETGRLHAVIEAVLSAMS